jgi:hypothetical protein
MCTILPNSSVKYYLANESDATLTGKIKSAIMRQLGAEICTKSHLMRGWKYTMVELTAGLPDYYIAKAQEVVLQMTDEYTLLRFCENDQVYFRLNPNKNDVVKKILSATNTSIQPIEEMLPSDYRKAFETEGAKTTKGFVTRYLYYRDPNDSTHFYALVQRSVHVKADKIDLGSMFDATSTIYIVWNAIDKKLKKTVFRKADLNTIISDYSIVENRQPVKAAIDVLEYLSYIKKTGKRHGRSEEYEKTGKVPPISILDEFL